MGTDEKGEKDEMILAGTGSPEVSPASKLMPPNENSPEENVNPWHGIEPERVALNKHIKVGYVSEANLKLVIQRLRNIHMGEQKKFKKIIEEMQSDDNLNNSHEYSARISGFEGGLDFYILFLNFSRYLKSLLHPPTRRILEVADLVYPQGFLMQWAFRRLSGEDKPKHEFLTKFDFAVSLFSSLDEYFCSVFLIGGKAALLNRVEENFKTSFSNVKVLGRYTTLHAKERRIDEMRTVISKTAPTLLLVAKNASIHDFIDGRSGERKIRSFLVLDYPEALRDFSGTYRRKKKLFLKVFPVLSYLIFPWQWLKLLCILTFLI
ncbi:MAG: WecB/TagA/CpsF family glycosyltransferase, partial [Spirochaetota bacterium]